MQRGHLVDVFEFVYDLADDWLRGLVASRLRAGEQPLQAGPRKPDRKRGKTDSVLMFLIVWRSFTEFLMYTE